MSPGGVQGANNAKVFGAPLEGLLKDGDKIPVVVERLINAIETTGLFTVGLYRKSGVAPRARELRTLIEAGGVRVTRLVIGWFSVQADIFVVVVVDDYDQIVVSVNGSANKIQLK